MKRIEVIKAIAEEEGLIIANLGFSSRELYSVHDKPTNFYMLGSMGMASSIGLGLALAQKRRVYVIDGDGSILMNLGSLVTIAHYAPSNYCLTIIDNGSYESSGNQPTPTAQKTNLEHLARAAGITQTKTVDNVPELRNTLNYYRSELLVIIAKTEASHADVPPLPLLPHSITKRFMIALIKTTDA